MAQQEADGPARGGTKTNQTVQDVSDIVANSRNVTGRTGMAFQDENAPARPEIHLAGLGNISEVDPEFDVPTEDEQEGEGEYVVVLADYLSGAKGVGFQRGDVRRVSKVIPAYGDKDNIHIARANAKRLFEQSGIRLATENEVIRSQALDPETNSPKRKIEITTTATTTEMDATRAALISAERERDLFRQKYEELANAQARAASPKGGTQQGGQQIPGTPDF